MLQQIEYKKQILEFSNLNLITGTNNSGSYSLFEKLTRRMRVTKQLYTHVAYNRTLGEHPYNYQDIVFKNWFLEICGIDFTQMKDPFKRRISEVIKALIFVEPGESVFLEYPEIYLHSSGQSKLAELICEVLNKGVQVFCLTHSDHLFDSTRVLIKEDKLNLNSVKIYFFDDDVYEIILSKRGRITGKIPDKFYDQHTIHLDKLL